MLFFQLSNYFGGLWDLGCLASVALTLKTSKKVGKLEKHDKSWKKLEKVGKSWKIEGFPTFYVQKVGKTRVFSMFSCERLILHKNLFHTLFPKYVRLQEFLISFFRFRVRTGR